MACSRALPKKDIYVQDMLNAREMERWNKWNEVIANMQDGKVGLSISYLHALSKTTPATVRRAILATYKKMNIAITELKR